MKKTGSLSVLALSALLGGCATQMPAFESFQAQSLDDKVKSGQWVQKTDNLFVVFDASSSMNKTYKRAGYSAQPKANKFNVEKEILRRVEQTIPDIRFNSGIRSFGFGPCMDWEHTKLNKSLEAHTSGAISSSLQTPDCAGGGTPMSAALEEVHGDIGSASGKTALLILSDGQDYSSKVSPEDSVSGLKERFGDNLCVYTVWVGNQEDKRGRDLLARLAEIGGCGFSTQAAQIASANDMAFFVERVFFEPSKPVDPCSLDDDGDGVNNCVDKCPDTPKGAEVDAVGCWSYRGVLFDFDKSIIKPDFVKRLQNVIHVMNLNPDLTVSIEGHTDNFGSDSYNQALSQRRAHAVKKYLVDHGISASRMEAHGYGESRPIDTNDTEEGRYNNRRVEFKKTNK
ncbi:MAG: hypothetical protein Kow0065_12770 [Methylomicrobium sp.]